MDTSNPLSTFVVSYVSLFSGTTHISFISAPSAFDALCGVFPEYDFAREFPSRSVASALSMLFSSDCFCAVTPVGTNV